MINIDQLIEIDELEDSDSLSTLQPIELKWIVEHSASDNFSEEVFLELVSRQESNLILSVSRVIISSNRDPMLKVCALEELFSFNHSEFLEIVTSELNSMSILECIAIIEILLNNKLNLKTDFKFIELGTKVNELIKSHNPQVDFLEEKVIRVSKLWTQFLTENGF